nr:hypothetical protein [Tanacetum cinerariifolium]
MLSKGVGNKMHKAFPLPVMEFPLPREVPTASEESSHCQKKREATAHKIALLLRSSSNYPIKENIMWYQSLVRSFDQEKNNIQAQQKKKMVKTSSSSENDLCCSKACKKNTETLNNKITDLTEKLCDSKNMIYHYKLALAQVEERPAELRNRELKYCENIRVLEFTVEARANCIESLTKELEHIKKEKEGLTSLPEFADDTVTDYSRPSPAIESTSGDVQNINTSDTKAEASPSTISPKPFTKFVKATDSPKENKTDKGETVKKPAVKYVELYRKPTRKSKVKGNQRN